MPEVEARSWFYSLNGCSLSQALGPLLEKCLLRGWRVLVLAERGHLSELDRDLWTWRDDSFIAHGLASGEYPEAQPVLLSEGAEFLNGAQVLVLLDGIEADSSGMERCLVLFEDDGGVVVERMRERYRVAREDGGARFFSRTSSGWMEKGISVVG